MAFRLLGLCACLAVVSATAAERIVAGYTGAVVSDEQENWRAYLPLLRDHGFNTVTFKIHPRTFPVDVPATTAFIHALANTVAAANLDLYCYLYDGGVRSRPTDSPLPAFVNRDGITQEQTYCLYQVAPWLDFYSRAFYLAERSLEVPIAGVGIDFEHIQAHAACVCDDCFGSFARRHGHAAPVAAPDRWAWVEAHGGREAYFAHLEARMDDVVREYAGRLHAVNPKLRLGFMPVRDTFFHRPWLRHLATPEAPAIVDSWSMYGGAGYTDCVAAEQAWVKELNPNNLYTPWFRPNNYRPADLAAHALVAGAKCDGYNMWQLNMLHPDQPAGKRDSYALPEGFKDPMAYWRAFGEANDRLRQWLANPGELTWEPIDVLAIRVDLERVGIPDVLAVGSGTPPAEPPIPTGMRGSNTLYIHVTDPAEPIRIRLAHTADARRVAPLAWALLRRRGQPVAEGTVAHHEVRELSLSVPDAATYAFAVACPDGGGPWWTIQILSDHHYGIDAHTFAYFFRDAPPQYFWVPAGLASFRVTVRTGARKQATRLRIWQADGAPVVDEVIDADDRHEKEFTIPVPAGMAGAAWSLHQGPPEAMPPTHYSENYFIAIQDASPYLADRSAVLLTPDN